VRLLANATPEAVPHRTGHGCARWKLAQEHTRSDITLVPLHHTHRNQDELRQVSP
jgi:hypothetical protein